MGERGNYIVIEGLGDTTTQAKLLADHLTIDGVVSHFVHEAAQLETPCPRMSQSAVAELLRLTAYRLDLYNQEIAPVLGRGEMVVADGNWRSSLLRQGIARRLGEALVHQTTREYLPREYVEPKFTVVLYEPNQLPFTEFNQIIPVSQKIKGTLVQTGAYVLAAGSDEAVHDRIMQKLKRTRVI